MTPEQMQQMMSQQMQMVISAMPFWVKAIYALGFLDLLVVAICLPLITWKLYFGNKPANPASLTADEIRLQQIRERREPLQKLSGSNPFGSGGDTRENLDNDSRFMPKR